MYRFLEKFNLPRLNGETEVLKKLTTSTEIKSDQKPPIKQKIPGTDDFTD